MSLEIETWRGIRGFDKYMISSFGRIKSSWFNKERILKQTVNQHGYLVVILYNVERKRCAEVQRLVAEEFIKNINKLRCVNHKNGVKTDNRVCNLEWCSDRDNQLHSHRTGLHRGMKGENSPVCKLKNDDVLLIRELCEDGRLNQGEIAKIFNIKRNSVSMIHNRKRWAHI